MGWLDWFKTLASGKPAGESPEAVPTPASQAAASMPEREEEGTVAGLDFKTAIDAHMKWKVRLERCLDTDNEEGLQVDTISRDDQCPLGKWIHGVGGERFGNLREFQEMKMEHSRFHLCAGDVLACCVAGDKEGASQKLRSGDYTRASERVKLHLARLYVQVARKD
ncbi:MAG: CZB domain-containing protein [Gallionellaceae bacterium]|nr:CZB domain-containing protein [Gallionellaceae bacterium]MDD5365896.1 CZB domain-containing protein [Gallionellaceae bacterium]